MVLEPSKRHLSAQPTRRRRPPILGRGAACCAPVTSDFHISTDPYGHGTPCPRNDLTPQRLAVVVAFVAAACFLRRAAFCRDLRARRIPAFQPHVIAHSPATR